MPIRLDTADAGFETAFRSFLDGQRGQAGDVGPAVAEIIADVRTRGDEAVFEATQRFDGLRLAADNLRIPAAEIDAATAKVPQAEGLRCHGLRFNNSEALTWTKKQPTRPR